MMIKAIVSGLEDDQGRLIIAVDDNLPLNSPADLQYFRKQTEKSLVVMGRRTWEHLPKKPLPNRYNAVVTKHRAQSVFTEEQLVDPDIHHFFNVTDSKSLLRYIEEVATKRNLDTVWIIGGASLYSLAKDLVDEWHVTMPNPNVDYTGTLVNSNRKTTLDKFVIFDKCSKLKSITPVDESHSVYVYAR